MGEQLMKTDLAYLPENKQVELEEIATLINRTVPAEMVILFGSYARNSWVEEKYDDEHYRYQSDFDILVIVETKSEFAQSKFERNIEDIVDQKEGIRTPISIIVHDVNFINRRLGKAQYFFTDIKKEGVLLYDSGKYQLNDIRELLPEERQKLAKEDFEYWFNNAHEFFLDFKNAFNRESYSKAAFELHQTAERLYSGILLVFTRYKPNTHDLAILRRLTNSVDSRLVKIFPLDDLENKRLFKLLRKAYVDARYKRSYEITKNELDQLSQRIDELYNLGKSLCQEKINGFTADSLSEDKPRDEK